MKTDEERMDETWDVKTLKLAVSNGGETNEDWLTFEVFSDRAFSIQQESSDPKSSAYPRWFIEEIPLDAARRLRDFLIYAVPGPVVKNPGDS